MFERISALERSSGRAGSSESTVSFYGRAAQFRLSTAALEQLGNPTRLEVMFDPDTEQIAFIPSDAAYAVLLRADSETAKNKYFGFRALADRAGLEPEWRFTLPLVVDEASGYHVINLNDKVLAPPSRAGRRKKSETDETTETVESATETTAADTETTENAPAEAVPATGRRNRS